MARDFGDLSKPENDEENWRHLIAIDPGRDKCGVAIMAFSHQETSHRVLDMHVLERRIVPRAEVLSLLETSLAHFSGAFFVIGHATTSRALKAEIAARFPDSALHEQDETGSTLEARGLYWRENPPRGWRKMWPLSLQTPPEPIDDFAAVVLAQRFLQYLGERAAENEA